MKKYYNITNANALLYIGDESDGVLIASPTPPPFFNPKFSVCKKH